MKRPKRDPVREDRIYNEAIVDARPEERAMSWYYYLEGKISFPFQARCVTTKAVSPLRKGETTEVLRMAKEDACEQRHACANPLAGAEDGRSAFATRCCKPGRIHQRSHRRLALLGVAGLPSLSSWSKPIRRRPASKPRCMWQSANRDRNQRGQMLRRSSRTSTGWDYWA